MPPPERRKDGMKEIITTGGPDVALLKSTGRASKIIIGGSAVRIPILDRMDAISVAMRTLHIQTRHGLTSQGVPLNVDATCQVKLTGYTAATSDTHTPHASSSVVAGDLRQDDASLWLAAQHFINKTDAEVDDAIRRTIEGHQRSIVASLTVEQLYADRPAFSRRVVDTCQADLRAMGLCIVSYVVNSLSDDRGYLDALGFAQTARVKCDGDVGRAVNRAAARVRTAQQDARAHVEENAQLATKIESDKLRAVRSTDAQAEVARRVAARDVGAQIAAAEQNAILFVKRKQALAKETEAELDVMRREVQRQRLAQEKDIHVDADAELYKANVEADTLLQETRAEVERIRLMANAEAEAARAEGKAENDLLEERNLAWLQNGTYGAIMEQMAEAMPKVAAEIAAPLRNVKKVFLETD